MNKPFYYKQKAQEVLRRKRGPAAVIVLFYIIISFIPDIVAFISPLESVSDAILRGEEFVLTSDYVIRALFNILFYCAACLFGVWMMLAFFDLYRKDEQWCEIRYKSTAGKFSLAALVIYIFTFLWTLLLIIPGIIKSLAYSQTLFILKDNPDISIMNAITESENMMRGHKWEYFYLSLTFIGWMIVSIASLGLGLMYTLPYIYTTVVAYYEDLKVEYRSKIEGVESSI